MPDVMIDFETLSLSPTPVVLSVALVTFNPHQTETREKLYQDAKYLVVAPGDQQERGLEVSYSTFRWWLKQDELVRTEAFSGRTQPEVAAEALKTYLAPAFDFNTSTYEPVTLWMSGVGSRGVTNDCAWLHAFLAAYGYDPDLNRHDVRDCTTVFGLARSAGWVAPERNLASYPIHHALWDAVWQVKLVQSAFVKLRLGRAASVETMKEAA